MAIGDKEEAVKPGIFNFLRDYGCKKVITFDKKQSLAELKEKKPDIILIDLKSSKLDGFELVPLLRKKSPDTPIIVFSTVDETKKVARAMSLGAWDYLFRPIKSFSIFEHIIKHNLEKAELLKKSKKYSDADESRLPESETEDTSLSDKIGQYKETARKLKQSRNRLHSILAKVPDIIYQLNKNGEITYINEAITHYGYDHKKLIGKNILDLITPEDREKAVHKVNERRTGERHTKNLELKIVKKIELPCIPSLVFEAEGLYKNENPKTESFYGTQGIARDNTFDKLTKEKIEQTLQKKDVLLKEVHHRVKNNLQIISSILSLQSNYIKKDIDREIFLNCRNRVKSMALIHEQLYKSENFADIRMEDYIKVLVNDILASFHKSHCTKTIMDLDPVTLNIEMAIPCGLIINELLSNSLKHAFGKNDNGEIEVRFKVGKAQNALLVIRDNGKGFPEGFDFTRTESLGFQLVNALISQINGKISHSFNGGLEFNITFPLNRN